MLSQSSLAHRVSQGLLFGTIGGGLAKITSLASGLVVFRTLSLPEYGSWTLALALLGLFYTFAFDGFDRVILADLSQLTGKGDLIGFRVLFAQYALALVIVACVLTVTFIGFVLIIHPTSSHLVGLLLLMGLTFIPDTVRRILRTWYSGHLDFLTVTAINVAPKILYLFFLVLFVLFFRKGLYGVALAYAASSGASALLFLPRWFARLGHRFRLGTWSLRRSPLIWSVRGHGHWALYSEILDDLTRNVMPWLVHALAGVSAVGIFGFARTLLAQLVSILPLSTIMNPLLGHEYSHGSRFVRLSRRALKYSLWMAPAVMSLALVIKVAAGFLFPNYLVALPYFYAMLPSIFFLNGTTVMLFVLHAAQRQETIFFGNLVKPIYVVTVFPLLVWLGGVWGAVLGYVLLTAITFWVRYATMERAVGVAMVWREVLEFDDADRRRLGIMWGRIRAFASSRSGAATQ